MRLLSLGLGPMPTAGRALEYAGKVEDEKDFEMPTLGAKR